MDLPGHEGRMDDPLTLDTAVESINAVLRRHTLPYKGVRPALMGGSLGGYIASEFLGKYPTTVSAATSAMCGQGVGVGRS